MCRIVIEIGGKSTIFRNPWPDQTGTLDWLGAQRDNAILNKQLRRRLVLACRVHPSWKLLKSG